MKPRKAKNNKLSLKDILSLSTTTNPKNNLERYCFNCLTKTTPFWRKDPTTKKYLCNACGLYVRNKNVKRPVRFIRCGRSTEVNVSNKTCEFCFNYVKLEDTGVENNEMLKSICDICRRKYKNLKGCVFYEFNIYDN